MGSGPQGVITILADTGAIPTSPPVSVQTAETWHFQCWFRDKNPTPTSNFTDGAAATFE